MRHDSTRPDRFLQPFPAMMFHRFSSRVFFAVALPLAAAAPRLSAAEIPPIGPGPYAVGSTNMEVVDHPVSPMIDYLKGKSVSRKPIYIAEILTHPGAALLTQVAIPADPAIYGRHAGSNLPLVLYVLYPTSSENKRDDYKFPYPDTADNVFPHMQKAEEKPIFAGNATRYPLIVFSHGYEGHGLWDLDHLRFLAAHGYIVVSVFHGDGRANFEANFGIRPIALKAALDYILNHPDFGPAIDPDRIGVSGGSFGGYTILAAMGGKYLQSAEPAADSRIKAGFGLVPFMGGTMGFWPFATDAWVFGKDYSGLKTVQTPFMAIYGEKDTNVPPKSVMGGIAQMSGPASAVMLDGEQHLFSKKVWTDVYTWEVLFFNTWLRGDAEARKQLYGGTSVQGGVTDHKTYQHAARPLQK
jgi:acetyl esterase/lipase